jgi:hypothetical protein
MSLNLTSAGLDQLLNNLQEQGYRGTRQYLEHLVLKASSTSGLGLLQAGLEHLVLEKRFDAESVQSFRQIMDFWSTRFVYATVRVDHNHRFDILFWKAVDEKQIQESARFYLSMESGHGEILMKLKDQPKPERRLIQLETAKGLHERIHPEGEAQASGAATLEPVTPVAPVAWAEALMDDIVDFPDSVADDDGATSQ